MGPLGVGAFPDGEWDCFGKILANEAHYWSLQLLGEDDENVGMQSMFCSTLDAGGNKNCVCGFQLQVQHCMKNQKLDRRNKAKEINAGSDHGHSCSSYTQERITMLFKQTVEEPLLLST
ncbi:hypothetical protein CR513_51179, partial [Mucuna pruriens]